MRNLVLLLSGLLLAPTALAAQFGPPERGPRLSFTAYTGARVPFTTGHVVVFGEEGAPLFSAREQRSGNPVLGAEAQAHVVGRLSFLAGTMYSRTGSGEFFIDRDPSFGDPGDLAIRYLSDTWLVKAGASFRFAGDTRASDGRTMPSTDLFAAGAVVRQFESSHPAVNLGFTGSLPLGSGVHFSLGVEDYLVFWDEGALEPILLDILRSAQASSAAAEMLYDTSHLLVLRVGATLTH